LIAALNARRRPYGGRVGLADDAEGSVLMDQALVAGIGNIYADEILFQHARTQRRRSTG
jgi:formamidopyrimidine-DNA glycosylase